ncbi:MAG: formylglycine-generating enzyme family protein [Anaerolineae bacterium]|nr:formylglycine-generating enzyme family protein [Anaerolineae bacterium]
MFKPLHTDHTRHKRPTTYTYVLVFALIILLLTGLTPGYRIAVAQANTATPAVGTAEPGAATPDTQQTIAAVVAVTANKQWKPVIEQFDGVDMVLVPPGCFMIGSDAGDSDEKPVTKLCFDKPFWIDRTEVTNEQFTRLGGQAERTGNWTDPKRPREHITWFEARDFCAKRGARLPTEAEWEYAARGPDNLVYPWGNDFMASSVVYSSNSSGHTAEVGSKPDGASWVGAHDLSGLVWEWVSSLHRPYPYSAADGRESNSDTRSMRVRRGGSWSDNKDYVRAAKRDGAFPSLAFYNIGFRCARS